METSLFKRILFTLFLVLSLGLFVGCGKDLSYQEKLDKAELIILEDGDTLDSITKDISFITSLEGKPITYNFSPSGIILEDGKVNQKDEDTDVTIYVMWKLEERNILREIQVKVLKKSKKMIEISFDYEGFSPIQIEAGKTALLPLGPEKPDYYFMHWSETKDGGPVRVSLLDKDTRLYPIFRPNFKISFLNTSHADMIYKGGELVLPTINDERFLYWSLEEDGSPFDPKTIKGSVSLYAVYRKDPVYRISFEAEGIDDINYVEGTELILPFGKKVPGKHFLYWSLSPDGNEVNQLDIKSDVKLYPIYEVNTLETITVTFDEPEVSPITVKNTEVLVLPDAPIKEGKVFRHWSKEVGGKPFDPSTLKENILLHAVYESQKPLEIIYLNDLHGSILDTIGKDSRFPEIGLARIAHFIKQKRLENPDILFLTGGDILQGSALSNYYNGASTLDILNMMGLDFFTIGNHEFDWGLEKVTKQFGKDTKYSFPLVSCNIFYKGTDRLADNAVPYYIYEKGGHKVGVIGYIGQLKSSISASKTVDYDFRLSTPEVAKWAKHLRTVEHVDVVIAVGHQSSDASQELRNLTGDERVDMVFSAHTHRAEIFEGAGKPPLLQAYSNGKAVGYVKMEVIDGKYQVTKAINYDYDNNSDLFSEEDPEVLAKIQSYQAEIAPIMSEVLIKTETNISRTDFTLWLAKLIRVKTGSDVGTYNTGGVRFPIDKGDITVETLYKVIPFDNLIKSTLLTGDSIKRISSPEDFKAGLNKYSLENDTKYRIVTNEYEFDKVGSAYQRSDEADRIIYDGFIRDWVIDELRLQKALYGTFSLENEILSEKLNLSGDINGYYQVI